ncbi:alcohol dehydrogenase catalytic domain-containing protein [Parasphingorhabdus pacifica]
MTRMHAAVLHGAEDLRVQQREVPRAGTGAALVKVEAVGLCGSDLHYYREGRNGTNVLREPAVLGHEIGGTVVETGSGTPDDLVGRRVVVEPAAPCRTCVLCVAGRYNLCPHSTCLGSPPVDGGLAGYVTAPIAQLHPAPEALEPFAIPVLEPLAVAVHALRRADFTPGQSVLVTGAGPVGLLVAQVARAWGAREVAISDVDPRRLDAARALGVERALLTEELHGLRMDRSLECSGSAGGLAGALAATTPGGRVVLVGTMPAADSAVALSQVQRHEVDLVGTFRYAAGFSTATDLVARGAVEVASLVTDRFPLTRSQEAFDCAASGRGLKTVIDCIQQVDPRETPAGLDG